MNGVEARRMPVEGAAHRLEAQLLGSADFRREADPVAGESQQRRGPLLAKRHQVGNTPARDRARHRRSLGEEAIRLPGQGRDDGDDRSEEHTSELQYLMRNSYAVFCLKKNI